MSHSGGEPNTARSPRFQDNDLVRLDLNHPDVAAAAEEETLYVDPEDRWLYKFKFARVIGTVQHPRTGEWWCCVQALYSEDKIWMREDWFCLLGQPDPAQAVSNLVASVALSLAPVSQVSISGKIFNLKLLLSSSSPPQEPDF